MSCLLCENAGGLVVWSNDLCRVVLPDEPDFPGFVRVIAQDHVQELTDLSDVNRERLMAVVWQVERVVRDVMQPDKVNLASLGNVVAHVHWHVVARFANDSHFPDSIWSPAKREPAALELQLWQERAKRLPEALSLHLESLAL